jgi:flagellar assembly protein FliH
MQLRRFLFDHSFDRSADEPADDIDTDAMAAAAAEQEAAAVEAARAEGLSEGYARALAEREDIAAARQAAALEGIAARLDDLLARAADGDLRRSREAAGLALSIARHMVPVLARSAGFAEIEAVVVDCLRGAIDEPRIVLRVAEDFFDTARRRIEPLAREAGFAGRVIILADPALGAADCRVEWADGGTERNAARLWRDIESTMSNTLAAFERGPTADAA